MQYSDIIPFAHPSHQVDVSWAYLEETLDSYAETGLDLDPDFQRGHVWSMAQRVAYIEYSLRGGESARNIYFNAPEWRRGRGNTQLIDGKQRLESVRMFMADKVRVFGGYTNTQLGGKPPIVEVRLRLYVHQLKTRREVLQWYLGMNSGGSIHSKKELDRVRALLAEEME